MPKPQNKTELQSACTSNYERLIQLIDLLPREQQHAEFPASLLNRNIRDVLGHLNHWHKLFLGWYSIGIEGKQPPMPAQGYSWKQTPELNRKIQHDYSSTPLKEMRNMLNESYQQVLQIIDHHTNEELFEKQRFKWTGSTSLGAYLISNTSSHYDWAYSLIRKALKDFNPR